MLQNFIINTITGDIFLLKNTAVFRGNSFLQQPLVLCGDLINILKVILIFYENKYLAFVFL